MTPGDILCRCTFFFFFSLRQTGEYTFSKLSNHFVRSMRRRLVFVCGHITHLETRLLDHVIETAFQLQFRVGCEISSSKLSYLILPKNWSQSVKWNAINLVGGYTCMAWLAGKSHIGLQKMVSAVEKKVKRNIL